MKRTIFLALLFLLFLDSHAQEESKKIGDKLPDISFKKVINHSRASFPLSSLTGKLLLVEFWSSRCGGCLSSMVKLADLKKKYGNQLDVILVTLDSAAALKAFLTKRPDLAALGLPFVPRTKEWEVWFPHKTWPHLIWIGSDREVKAITESKYATEKNIDLLLQNGRIRLPEKRDLKGFDYHAPFFLARYEMPLIHASALTGPIDGIGAQGGFGKLDSVTMRLYATNATFKTLCAFAWRYQVNLHKGNYHTRMVMNLSDSSFLAKDEYGFDKKYCYELTVPKNRVKSEEAAFRYMQQDLDRYFGIKTTLRRKKALCLVLQVSDTLPSVLKKEADRVSLSETWYHNTPVKSLVPAIETALNPDVPVIYEGPSSKKASITLKTRYEKVEDLQRDLKKAGLILVFKEAEADFFEITN